MCFVLPCTSDFCNNQTLTGFLSLKSSTMQTNKLRLHTDPSPYFPWTVTDFTKESLVKQADFEGTFAQIRLCKAGALLALFLYG